MSTDPVFAASVVFASVTAGAGFALSVLAWEAFRGSPFGRLLGVLAVLLFALSAYHALLLVVGRESIPVLEAVAFTGLLAYVGLMVRLHDQVARKPERID